MSTTMSSRALPVSEDALQTLQPKKVYRNPRPLQLDGVDVALLHLAVREDDDPQES